MNRRLRWIPAKTNSLGQNQFLNPPAQPAKAPDVENKQMMNGLIYGGLILAGIALVTVISMTLSSEGA